MTEATSAALRIRDLLDRLTRLHAAASRIDDLNPTQVAALSYLLRANRYSRAPSQVAEYLSVTRGTVSQTLRALLRKGLVAETRSEQDRRSISYALTDAARSTMSGEINGQTALETAPEAVLTDAASALEALVSAMLAARGGRSFGLCRNCRHHRPGNGGARCALLDVALDAAEYDAICYEQEPGSPALIDQN